MYERLLAYLESDLAPELGAVAVTAAIAFGIGGRDVAARHLETWAQSLENRQ